MEEEKTKRAQDVFQTLCAALDGRGWHYDKNEEKLRIDCSVQGEDLPMSLSIRIDVGRQLILLLSHLPLTIPEDKRMDAAIAVSAVNNVLIDGSFDFDVTDGHMLFRMTSSFLESEIGVDLFDYLIRISCLTVDEYNDKFLLLGKNVLSLEAFLQSV